MLNEPLCNGANGSEILQKFQNDTTTSLIINNMNENESIKIEIVKLDRKHFMSRWHHVPHYDNIVWHIIESTIYSNDPCYCWDSYNFQWKTDGFVELFSDIIFLKKWSNECFFTQLNFFFFYTPSRIESRRLFG